jgi:hypothetical protein
MIILLAGLAGVLGFLAIPFRIVKAHKAGDAEFGDYAFLIFLAYLVTTLILGLILGWFK